VRDELLLVFIIFHFDLLKKKAFDQIAMTHRDFDISVVSIAMTHRDFDISVVSN